MITQLGLIRAIFQGGHGIGVVVPLDSHETDQVSNNYSFATSLSFQFAGVIVLPTQAMHY